MAETFLSPLIQKLIDLPVEEAKSCLGVPGEVQSLKDELAIIQPLLKDAEAKSQKGESRDTVKAWVKQIREAASRIEDVIDAYSYHVEQQHQEQHQGCFIQDSLRKAGHFIKSLKPRCGIASEIKTIQKSLSEIKSRAHDYGLRPLEQGSSSGKTANTEDQEDPRLRSLFIENDELVGIESTSKELVGRLVEGPSTRTVISLVGEGGVGKTTLVKKVYDDDVVKRHFESARAWITVSQPFNLKKILKKMKEEICKTEDKIATQIDTVEELIEHLRIYLQTKRYVIVFDDVWLENFWEKIKLALPSNNEGSRILITTRNTKVANSCQETPHDLVQNLKPWSPTLAWELFSIKAFRYEFQGKCPEKLIPLSLEIVGKCQGLPLVISAIASLLSTKEKVDFEWQKLLNDLKSKVEMNSQFTSIPEILSLSYYDLPDALRSCFLYFGLFPEDYVINDERLYRLWIADGLVKPKRGRSMEEVAEEYLNELVQRNLVICDQWQSVGEGIKFRVHDLMRDVILSRADETCFCQIWDEENSKSRVTSRRLTIYGNIVNDVVQHVQCSGVRSIFIFDIDDQLTQSFIASLFKKFKLLEVLDFENVPVDALPKELGNLLQLKYLSLKSTNIKMLPKSISKLQNLQSLDIRGTLIREIPNQINKLKNLRHLLAYSYNYGARSDFDFVIGVTFQEGFGDLVELQTLTLLEANLGGVDLMRELEKLRKLRWLGISKLTRETGRALCSSIGKMDHLERLFMSSIDENELLDLEVPTSSSPQFLRDLILTGWLEKFPEWILNLRHLRGLSLACSRLIDDPSKYLKGLPNLETLQLGRQSYEGKQLHFEKGSFQKLKRLHLIGLAKLEVVKIDRGALPLLEELAIEICVMLREAPTIADLGNIKRIVINSKRLL